MAKGMYERVFVFDDKQNKRRYINIRVLITIASEEHKVI